MSKLSTLLRGAVVRLLVWPLLVVGRVLRWFVEPAKLSGNAHRTWSKLHVIQPACQGCVHFVPDKGPGSDGPLLGGAFDEAARLLSPREMCGTGDEKGAGWDSWAGYGICEKHAYTIHKLNVCEDWE